MLRKNSIVSGAICATQPTRLVRLAIGEKRARIYLVQYIKYYEHEGITIEFVGFLNEPEYRSVVCPVFSTIKIARVLTREDNSSDMTR